MADSKEDRTPNKLPSQPSATTGKDAPGASSPHPPKEGRPAADSHPGAKGEPKDRQRPTDVKSGPTVSPEPAQKTAGKTTAAERIIDRLEKGKTPAPSGAKEEKAGKVLPAPQPEPPAKEEEKVIEITLTGEMAKIAHALEQKMVTEENVVRAFLSQIKLEKREENRPLLQLLEEDKALSAKQVKGLQSIETMQVRHTSPAPRQLDFMVGQQLLEKSLITRAELQQILRMQVNLRKMGISRTLETLLLQTKSISEEILLPIISQYTKPAEFTAKKNAPLSGGRRQTFPVITTVVAVAMVFVFSYLALLWDQVEKTEIRQKQAAEAKETPPSPPPLKVFPPRKEAEQERVDPKKHAAAQMQSMGLEKWGKHWIPKGRKDSLKKMGWKEGTRPDSVSFEMKTAPAITSRQVRTGWEVSFRGQLSELPKLPEGLKLRMEARVFHPFRQLAIDGTSFDLDETHKFTATIVFARRLPTNLYFLCLSLTPSRQDEFLRDFFQLQENQFWWFSFLSEDNSQIKLSWDNRKAAMEKYLETMDKYYQEIQDLPKNYQAPDKKSKDKLRAFWETRSPRWQDGMEKIQQQLEKDYENMVITVFPKTETELPNLLQKLSDIYGKWDGWQRDQGYHLPDMERDYIDFELKLHEMRTGLSREYDKLVGILQKEAGK